jgi:DNA-binding transcriptional regulator YbjK
MTATTALDGRVAKGERARRALIEAALALIARDGICAVTHRKVTREAGLPASSAAYHFSSIHDLLEQTLLWADRQEGAALARIGAHPDPVAAFSAWLVQDLVQQRSRVIAEYELYLYAARVPSMRPAAGRWLADLARLVSTWTDDPRSVGTICAYVDGLLLHALVSGQSPDAAVVGAAIRDLLQQRPAGGRA